MRPCEYLGVERGRWRHSRDQGVSLQQYGDGRQVTESGIATADHLRQHPAHQSVSQREKKHKQPKTLSPSLRKKAAVPSLIERWKSRFSISTYEKLF